MPSMRTFAEIADRLRNPGEDIEDDGTFALWLIDDLAAALDRLEFNLARQLALLGMKDVPCPKMAEGHTPMKNWEQLLDWRTEAALLALRSDPLVLD